MSTSTSRAAMLNKFRRHPRVRVPTPFACELTWRDEQRWFGKSVHDAGVVYDLSLRGMRVSTEAPIKPGDQVSLLIRLPRQAAPAEIAVATVRWTKDQTYGLAFQRLTATSHGRLRRYMTVLSKEAR
ncbi:MAG: PilZ domain-containing protein [Nitrospira sp.]